ncbi:MAG: 50S ribosomal protein L10 [Actinomycetota bacterium]|jgi:large subunit ribosomal protein L10
MARPEKEQAVEEIAGKFGDAQAALLTEYRGLTVGEIAEVRSALRDAEAEYKVMKNTLTRIAVREVGLDELVEMLQGPTAIAFCKGDAVAAAKALDDAAKKFPVLVIKGGVLRGQVIDAEQAKALAKLESREIQLAKIAILMNTPLQQTVNVFAAMLRDLGSMLAQVLAEKESTEPSAERASDTAGEDEGDAVETAAGTEATNAGDAVEDESETEREQVAESGEEEEK